MRNIANLFFLLIFPLSGYAQGKTCLKSLLPDYVQLQFAGNIGLLSAGVGYKLHKNLVQISLLNGYTPAAIAGRGINTIALRGTYDIARVPINKIEIIGYGGLGCNFETTGKGYYTSLPERYPKNYYILSAVHATAALGAKLHAPLGLKEGRGIDFYVEAGTLDTYMYYYFENTNLSLVQIFSAAVGLRYHF